MTRSWRELLAQDLRDHPPSSNVNGVMMSRESGGYRLEKISDSGEDYVVFAMEIEEAWSRLSQITGWEVHELKRMQLTRF